MEPQSNKKAAAVKNEDEIVPFCQVTATASGWMLDFLFVSLCWRFKEGNLDGFNETLSAFESISQSRFLKGDLHDEKTMICAFLTRVMHGKQLDVVFEEEESVMPLMSAAKMWSNLKETVEDESLFEKINTLLLVQSVAVCLEKGQRLAASSVLKSYENDLNFPQTLGVKLSTMVKQRDIYHPFLVTFSFSKLLETILSYLDSYLEKNPSDYLLKEATKAVQSSQNINAMEDKMLQNKSLSEKPKESVEKDAKKKKSTVCSRGKRKLLSNKITDLWKPDTCKKPQICLQRISKSELSRLSESKSAESSKIQKTRKKPQKWTPQLDKKLTDGVKHHGQGKWTLILQDYDFEGRTCTMLKDRWRVLLRAHKVG